MVGPFLAFLFFAAIIGIAVFFQRRDQSSTSRVSPSIINLDSVRDAMIEKYGWTEQRADAAREEYVRFLTLLQMKPGFMLVPWLDAEGRDDLDQFWHQHILDTAKYASDCQTLFGRMIHHNPHVPRGSEQEDEAATKTSRLYARTFGTGEFGAPMSALAFSGCSACAADSAGSHGHSDGSHSSHSDGGGSGHSCGGHSCGGHGCGHGCGGH